MNITASVPQPGYNPLSYAPITEDGDLDFTRVKTPDQARAIHTTLWQADAPQRYERANVQAMLDGRQPFNPATMAANGLAGCCNVNWRDGTLALQQAEAPYVDLLNSVPFFLNIQTHFGAHEDRLDWEQIMAEEFGFMLRSWESFTDRFLRLVNYFLAHGVSMAFWSNATDWRWNIGTLGEFVVPRLSTSEVASITYMSKREEYSCPQLFEYIKKCPPERRGGWYNGWHVPTTITAIKNAIPKQFYRANDWELSERLWKSSEVYWYLSDVTVPSFLLWVQELDQTISQCIVPENPLRQPNSSESVPDEQFMYNESNFLPRLDRGLVVFKYGVGTNGYLHSIRGLGNAIQPIVQAMNGMMCRQMDAVNLELSVPIRASEDIMNNELALQFAGPFWYLMEGVEIVARNPSNYSNSVLPITQQLNQKFNEQKGMFSGEANFNRQTADMTKFAFQALMEQSAGLRVSQANLFYDPWERLLRETLRRVIGMKSSMEVGGPEAFEFRKRCMARGVPVEAIDKIDIERCLVVRSIGNGSASARMAGLTSIESLVAQFDEQGRRNYVRDRIASQPGFHYSTADAYMPKTPNLRPDINVRFADLENKDMLAGNPMPIYPNDEHIVHARQHLAPMMEMVQAVEMGQMEMTEAVQPLSLLYQHTFEHLQMLGNDPIMQREINQYRKDMQQVAEIVVNGSRKIQAEQQKAMEAGEEYGGPEGLDPEQLYDVEIKKRELYRMIKDDQHADAMQQVAYAKANQELVEKEQQMVNNQRKTNAELTRSDVLTATKIATENAKLRQKSKK